jgi:hypothetical protein
MAFQGRNEMCGCGRDKKYKKCCGRFTFEELLTKLSAYTATNKQKDKLIERSLKFLKECEVNGGGAFLILVNPVTKEDIIDWTSLSGSKVAPDVSEAVLTRRILAGYLPIGCLVEDKSVESGWHAVIDATLVTEECRDEFVTFAQIEANVVAKTFNGAMSKEDSWMTTIPWGDLSYPGMPMKPRPAGTIRIEVNIPKRTMTTVWTMVGGSMEFPLSEELITGNDSDDIIYEARHVIEVLKQVNPPKGLVDGDKVEVWQMVTDGENKLLATTEVHITPPLIRSEFDVKGDQNAN